MQIDFHHAVTYTIARFAGFDHESAGTIAYASQYVDDSTSSGFLRFKNGARYRRDSTSHPMLDPKNLDNDDDALSWIPFHFFPGNNGEAEVSSSSSGYLDKLICRPDSPIAKAMIADAIGSKGQRYDLQRLGIAAHVFVDTFAHQGFVGQRDERNKASQILDAQGKSLQAMPVPPIGHGIVGSCPDRPYLKWSYTDYKGNLISRDNLKIFVVAANRLCEEFQRFQLGDAYAQAPGLSDSASAVIAEMLGSTTAEEGEARQQIWTDAWANDHFGFGSVKLQYVGKGEGSWKHQALGNAYLQWQQTALDAAKKCFDARSQSLVGRLSAGVQRLAHEAEAIADKVGIEPPVFPWDDKFLDSPYKLFHDAARDQRHAVFARILPRFGICAA